MHHWTNKIENMAQQAKKGKFVPLHQLFIGQNLLKSPSRYGGQVICQSDIYHPPKSDIYHPQIRTFPTPKKKHLPGGQLPPPIFFFFFWRTFLGFFDLQLMEDIKDGKEEVLDEVVMEHIKQKVRDEVVIEHIKQEVVVMVVMEDVTEEERSAELYVSVHGSLDHTQRL